MMGGKTVVGVWTGVFLKGPILFAFLCWLVWISFVRLGVVHVMHVAPSWEADHLIVGEVVE